MTPGTTRPGTPEPGESAPAALDWTRALVEQLDWHWSAHARPRLDGLSDEEYGWEPVPGSWSVRPRGQGVAMEVGSGDTIIDFAVPEPSPPPVTTISWRLAHLIVGVLGQRNAQHFGGPAMDYPSYAYAATAAPALQALDEGYAHWIGAVRALDAEQLAAPCGEAGHEQDPLADLVLHINREMIHHLAEIALLRDLYAHR